MCGLLWSSCSSCQGCSSLQQNAIVSLAGVGAPWTKLQSRFQRSCKEFSLTTMTGSEQGILLTDGVGWSCQFGRVVSGWLADRPGLLSSGVSLAGHFPLPSDLRAQPSPSFQHDRGVPDRADTQFPQCRLSVRSLRQTVSSVVGS